MVRIDRERINWMYDIQLSLALSITVVAFIAGTMLPFSPATNTARSVFSILIGAQSSVLAIVISVTLIAVQLVTSRYAPRMATLPFKTPLFKRTFFVFGASVLLSLFALMSVDLVPQQLLNGLLLAVAVLFVIVGVFLYQFVIGMVESSTPERLVALFTQTLPPNTFKHRVERFADEPEEHAHPLQPLYRFIMSAISHEEYATASAALTQYSNYCQTTLSDLATMGTFEEEAFNAQDDLFGPVVNDHLHEITTHAAENDESQLLSSAVRMQVDIGIQAMEISGQHKIPYHSLSGLRSTIIETPVRPDDYVTFNAVWPAVGELVVADVETEYHDLLLSVSNLINGRLATSLNRADRIGWHQEAMSDFFEHLCTAHEELLDQVAAERDLATLDVSKPQQRDEQRSLSTSELRYCVKAIENMAKHILQYLIANEEYPITWGNYKSAWADLCITTAEKGATKHTIWLCRTLIEMAFIENCERPFDDDYQGPFGINELLGRSEQSKHLFWRRELAKIRAETDEPVLERAFEEVLKFEYQEDPMPIVAVDNYEQVRSKYWTTSLGPMSHRGLNTNNQVPDLIEELEEKSRPS